MTLFKVGDLVVRKSSNDDIIFCIMDFKADDEGRCTAVLKAIYDKTFIVEAPINDLRNIISYGKL
ncbi:MAG TPA: hypothetical protein DEA47_04425 [Peptococcaceae bacterium]|nr:MAG: Uncharacterized protein XD50_1568 [Clostridia bacterium 41_269]HBT20593.1 hypothetical protein [Peptococcaceae bacterium]